MPHGHPALTLGFLGFKYLGFRVPWCRPMVCVFCSGSIQIGHKVYCSSIVVFVVAEVLALVAVVVDALLVVHYSLMLLLLLCPSS